MTARTGLFIVLLVTLLTIDVSATPVTDTWERPHFTQATSPYTTSDHLTMSLTLDVDVSLCPIPPCSVPTTRRGRYPKPQRSTSYSLEARSCWQRSSHGGR